MLLAVRGIDLYMISLQFLLSPAIGRRCNTTGQWIRFRIRRRRPNIYKEKSSRLFFFFFFYRFSFEYYMRDDDDDEDDGVMA